MKLNLGCGSDAMPGGEWVNVDRWFESDHHRKPTDPDALADAHALPFADGGFDHVRLRHVLEHCRDPIGVLTECRRVLADGGTCYVEVPDPMVVREERTKYHTMHLFSWTAGSLERICRHVGFDAVEYHKAHAEAMPGGHAVVARR